MERVSRTSCDVLEAVKKISGGTLEISEKDFKFFDGFSNFARFLTQDRFSESQSSKELLELIKRPTFLIVNGAAIRVRDNNDNLFHIIVMKRRAPDSTLFHEAKHLADYIDGSHVVDYNISTFCDGVESWFISIGIAAASITATLSLMNNHHEHTALVPMLMFSETVLAFLMSIVQVEKLQEYFDAPSEVKARETAEAFTSSG